MTSSCAERRSALRGVAVDRLLVVLCLVWIAAGVAWWMLADEVVPPPEPLERLRPPGQAREPRPGGGAPDGPTLEVTGEAPPLQDDAPRARLRRLAQAWMSRGGAGGKDEGWLAEWLAGDPRRVFALIDELLLSPAGAGYPALRGSLTYRLDRLGSVLARMRVDLVGTLATRLEEGGGNERHRAACLMGLAGYGSKARSALPLLRRMLAEVASEGLVRRYLPFAILRIQASSEEVVPLLAALLGRPRAAPDPDFGYDAGLLRLVRTRLRRDLACALAPGLVRLVAGKHVALRDRREALKLLTELPLADPDVRAQAVVAAIVRPESWAQVYAGELMKTLPEPRLLTLVPTLEEAEADTRVRGAAALIAGGVDGARLAHLVLPALQGASPPARERAVRLLPMVVKDVDEVLPIARAMLAGRDPALWLTATRALGALTSVRGDRTAVVRELVTCVESRDAAVRKLAVQSLLMFDDQSVSIVAMLGELLRDDDARIRAEAVDALGELSAHEPSARAALERALGDGDEQVRAVARYWLGEDD